MFFMLCCWKLSLWNNNSDSVSKDAVPVFGGFPNFLKVEGKKNHSSVFCIHLNYLHSFICFKLEEPESNR